MLRSVMDYHKKVNSFPKITSPSKVPMSSEDAADGLSNQPAVSDSDSGYDTPESEDTGSVCNDPEAERNEILMVEDDALNVTAIQGPIN